MPLPELSLPAIPDSAQAWLETTPTWITGLSGGLLLVAGGRLYKLAVVAPGIAGGVYAALMLPAELGPPMIAIAAVVLAIAGAILCRLLERLAVAGVGVLATAGVTQLAWPLVMDGQAAPWWGLLIGGAVGLLLFPSVFKALIRWITALVGALMVSWSLGYQENPWVVGGLFLAGCIVQAASGGGRRRKDEGQRES